MARAFFIAASISGFLSIVLGAFAAHGLAELVSHERQEVFATGAEYQMTQTLALFIVVFLLKKFPQSKLLISAAWSFIFGLFLFSGSLYLLVLLDMPALGMITPIGGMAFLTGWLCLIIFGCRTDFK